MMEILAIFLGMLNILGIPLYNSYDLEVMLLSPQREPNHGPKWAFVIF